MAGPERLNMAEESISPEGGIPPGVPQAPFSERMRYVSTLPEDQQQNAMQRLGLEVSGGAEQQVVLEDELNPEGKDPDTVASIMQEIHTMDAETREAHKDLFRQAVDILKVYAHKSKLLGLDAETILLEEDLKKTDQAQINEREQHHPGQGADLQRLLDNFDAAEEELRRVDNTLRDDQFRELFSKSGWEQLQRTREKLTADKANFEQQITNMTAPDFLGTRKGVKANIEQAKKQLKIKTREAREKAIKEQRAEPEVWELELEQILLQDAEPTIIQPVRETFAQQLEFYQQSNLDQAKEGLSWYFHEARRLNVFEDLEERLEHKYTEWANSLLPPREVSQLDMLTDSPGRITQKTLAEVEDEIIEYSNNLLDPNRPQYVEQSARWNILQRRGLSSTDSTRFQGIRVEFVRRAQAQIEDSLSNLDRGLKGQAPLLLPQRISGEWNVHLAERDITTRREKQALEVGMEPLFREESYYRIRLLGNTREQIELGADQAAENITESATTFDLSAIQQRMEMLLKALREKSTDLQRSERISKNEADDLIKQMEDTVTNKIDFFILDWAGQNLQMDLFNSYLEQRMRIRGVEKIRQMIAMNDGLEGIALIELLSELNRLYYRPQGFKGQLFDDDTTHKYLRSLLDSKIVNKLRQYALKGSNNQERSLSRENLTKASTADQFLSNFELKNSLINGKEFKSLTDEEWNKLTEEERNKYLTKDERNAIVNELDGMRPKEREQFFGSLTPDTRVQIKRWPYQQILEQFKQQYMDGKEFKDLTKEEINRITEDIKNLSPEQRETALQDLAKLRRVRKELAIEQSRYQEADRKAKSALTIAKQVMNIFGEAAELGAPSIIMDNGDYIRVDDAVLFYKYAILQAAKAYGEQYGAEDNMALIRWRSRMWIDRWKKAGLDRTKAPKDFSVNLRGGRQMNFTLKAGFEETGLTEGEWQAFENAVKEIRRTGFKAQINGVKFEDIIKMDHLKSVNNNFLADYKSSESQINNEVVLEQVAKGQLVQIRNVLRRLGLKEREGIPGKTTQQRIDNLTQMIEDSRALDAELERLAYFEATHGLSTEQITDPRMLQFSADRIDYGFQNLSWGVKRLHHLKAFWYTNLRRTVPRGVDLTHAMPFSLGSLSKEMTFENILELALNINTTANGMESVDNPALTLFADRHKDMVYLRAVSEGGVNFEKGKMWGFLEKLLVDANSLWSQIKGIVGGATPAQAIQMLASGQTELTEDNKEAIVNYFQEKTLDRFTPIMIGNEKLYGEDRQAMSSGAGFDENEKFALRFLEWLMSEKRASEEHGAREEGGVEAYSEITDIIKFIAKPGSYRAVYRTKEGKKVSKVPDMARYKVEGENKDYKKEDLVLDTVASSSLWDEVWRKLTPSHNIRLPVRAPEPTYVA